jgi:hypothetical protein
MIDETPAFMTALKDFVAELTPDEELSDDSLVVEDMQSLTDMLLKIKTACEEYDQDTVSDILMELKTATWTHQTKELLEKIDEQILHCEFDEIVEEIGVFIDEHRTA